MEHHIRFDADAMTLYLLDQRALPGREDYLPIRTLDETIRALHMTPAHGLQEALELARERLGNPNASITAIPDGVSVVTTLKE